VTGFTVDGQTITAEPDESIWQAARRAGIAIPHLCATPQPGYRADGNCRVCIVEIEGERDLVASCLREPADGMVVTSSARATKAREMVMELLLADQPSEAACELTRWAGIMGVTESRFPVRDAAAADNSHPAMAVNLDACIHCTRCLRACREVQVNDVIGMAGRGAGTRIVFDIADAMGDSTCVACGECVQACPTGALLPAQAAGEGKKVHSVCPYCGIGCQVTYTVADGHINHVEGRDGPANKGRLCVKGRFGLDYINHSNRLTVPLIRKDGAAKTLDSVDPADPSSHFRDATWEEALDVAASGLKRIRNRDGGTALAGFGSAKGSNEEAYLVQKLVRAGFGTNNVDHCTRLCHASSVAALMETIGSGAVTAPFAEAANAETIMVIGANPTENHPVAATFIKNAAQRGATLIVMDPRGQALKRHADIFVQQRPGSDVAMLNAVMHVIVEEGLYDKQYIKAHTNGFDALAEHLKAFSPEAMAEHCGVPAETLRAVARAYGGATRALIFWGMGIAQHVHGTDNVRCLISLALMCGQVGRTGSGLHPLRGQNNVQGASDVGLIPMVYPGYRPVGSEDARKLFEHLWGMPLDPEPGLTVVEIAEAAYQGNIKGIYVMGENPAMSDPNAGHVREALCRLEHLVVQDIFLTETAAFADVILPATAHPEKTGTFTNTDRRVQMGRQAVEPPGDARQDWWIVQEIARRIGLDWDYTGPADVYAEMRSCMPSIKGISWQRLEREDAVTYPCDAEDEPGHEVIFGDGFPTADSRGLFVPAGLVAPDETPDEAYPFVLTTGRQLEHWHTGQMTRRATVLNALEPEAVCELAPTDAIRLGIAAGDTVQLTTRRGAITLAARLADHIPEGAVFVPFCYAEAAANLLTNPALDPFGKNPELKYCAVRVEKM
jgi:formate dehydrogenase major subunit